MVKLTRRVSFSSGHRYWFAGRTDAENRAIFGKWASPYNHGHIYVLDVEVEGTVDPANGMVVNIKIIDDILQQRVVSQFDQRSINDEISHFADKAPNIENLLDYLRLLLEPALPACVNLTRISLFETPLLWGTWTKTNNMITLTRSYEFAASHRLNVPSLTPAENIDLFGKCNNPNGHGHNYVLEVTVTGTPDPVTGFIADLTSLDNAVHREVVDRYDHKNLNEDLPEFSSGVTTSEVVAQEIFNRLKATVPATLIGIKLHETARNAFEVTG